MEKKKNELSQLLKLKYQYWSNQRVTVENRIRVFLILGASFLISYLLTNRFHFSEPSVLELTYIDKIVPFLPWTAWIYVSDYLYPFVIGLQVRSSLQLTRVSFGFFLMIFFTNLTFLLLPIKYPRELFPIESGEYPLLSWIRVVDTPANCFPSAHVGIVWLTMLAMHREKPKQFVWYFIWAILIILSTLTTKQHYLVDVVAGALLGHFCYRTAERIVQ